jgi:hypothetical protein
MPKPGRFPIIVDPLVGMTQLTKALMDGGSGLNLMYLDTFEGFGLPVTSSKAAHTLSTEWSQEKIHPSWEGHPAGHLMRHEVVDFSRPYHIIMGRP